MDKAYEVEDIISHKLVRGKPLYEIKWKGYPSNQNTWEPRRNLFGLDDLLENYEKEHGLAKDKKSPFTNNIQHKKVPKDIKGALIQEDSSPKSDQEDDDALEEFQDEFLIKEEENVNQKKKVKQRRQIGESRQAQKHDTQFTITGMCISGTNMKDPNCYYYETWRKGERKVMNREEILAQDPFALLLFYENSLDLGELGKDTDLQSQSREMA